jgi:hypothetical protein
MRYAVQRWYEYERAEPTGRVRRTEMHVTHHHSQRAARDDYDRARRRTGWIPETAIDRGVEAVGFTVTADRPTMSAAEYVVRFDSGLGGDPIAASALRRHLKMFREGADTDD